MKRFIFTLLLLLFCTPSFALGNQNLQLLISPAAIAKKIQDTATLLEKDYKGEPLVIVMVMKGAICITTDLIRNLGLATRLEYIQAFRVKKGKQGSVKILGIEKLNIAGKNVLVVDDIFETGNTLRTVMDALQAKKPKSLKSLILLSKKKYASEFYIRPDYVLFNLKKERAKLLKDPKEKPKILKDIQDKKERILVGYGLDHHGNYRGLPGIYLLDVDVELR